MYYLILYVYMFKKNNAYIHSHIFIYNLDILHINLFIVIFIYSVSDCVRACACFFGRVYL